MNDWLMHPTHPPTHPPIPPTHPPTHPPLPYRQTHQPGAVGHGRARGLRPPPSPLLPPNRRLPPLLRRLLPILFRKHQKQMVPSTHPPTHPPTHVSPILPLSFLTHILRLLNHPPTLPKQVSRDKTPRARSALHSSRHQDRPAEGKAHPPTHPPIHLHQLILCATHPSTPTVQQLIQTASCSFTQTTPIHYSSSFEPPFPPLPL